MNLRLEPNIALINETPTQKFSISGLSAGLRQYTGDPSLKITSIQEVDLPELRPARGRIRALSVTYQTLTLEKIIKLIHKEPIGTTRTGTAGVGLREVSLYKFLGNQIPINIPQLYAAHPEGHWLALEFIENGIQSDQWTAEQYLIATGELVSLHDRFWGLGDVLHAYSWLASPLEGDFDIHMNAASNGIDRLIRINLDEHQFLDREFIHLLQQLPRYAKVIAATLLELPATLLHGEYWPGNIYIKKDGNIVIFDWQMAAIGPGVLDLLKFVKLSQWWFSPLPLSPVEIIQNYRDGIQKSSGIELNENQWGLLYDYAMLWTFIEDWIDIIAATPYQVLATRFEILNQVWIEPVREAIQKHFPEG
jgi:hypothetical protein